MEKRSHKGTKAQSLERVNDPFRSVQDARRFATTDQLLSHSRTPRPSFVPLCENPLLDDSRVTAHFVRRQRTDESIFVEEQGPRREHPSGGYSAGAGGSGRGSRVIWIPNKRPRSDVPSAFEAVRAMNRVEFSRNAALNATPAVMLVVSRLMSTAYPGTAVALARLRGRPSTRRI